MSMTGTYDNQQVKPFNTVRTLQAGAFVLRLAQQIAGASLIIAAILLWLAPGVSWSGDIILIKAVLSLTALVSGTAIMQAGRKIQSVEIEIDTIRRELRVINVEGAKREQEAKTSFADLYKVEQDGPVLRLWKDKDTLLAEIATNERHVFAGLLSGLRDAGKLA